MEYVVKVYNKPVLRDENGNNVYRSPNEPVLEVLTQKQNNSEHLSHIPKLIEYADKYEVFEYFDGEHLTDVDIGKSGAKFEKIVFEVTKAVNYFHSLELVHRDLKPANILIDGTLNVKLIDFGLAQKMNSGNLYKQSNDVFGTPEYQDPDNFDGKYMDYTNDYWSLGVIFYELISGHRLYEGIEGDAFTRRESIRSMARDYKNGFKNELAKRIDNITDEHNKRLIQGLLQIPGRRWGFDEIEQWADKNKEDPNVFGYQTTAEVSFDSTQFWGGEFSTDSVLIRTPRDLYEYLSRDYPHCNKLFDDKNIKSRLVNWVLNLPKENGDRILNLLGGKDIPTESNEYVGLVIQGLLEQVDPLYYAGVELTVKGIYDQIKSAKANEKSAIKWLKDVIENHILGTFDAIRGSRENEGLIENQKEINHLREQIRKQFARNFFQFNEVFENMQDKYLWVLFNHSLSENKGENREKFAETVTTRIEKMMSEIVFCYRKDQKGFAKRFEAERGLKRVNENSSFEQLFSALIVVESVIGVVTSQKDRLRIELNEEKDGYLKRLLAWKEKADTEYEAWLNKQGYARSLQVRINQIEALAGKFDAPPFNTVSELVYKMKNGDNQGFENIAMKDFRRVFGKPEHLGEYLNRARSNFAKLTADVNRRINSFPRPDNLHFYRDDKKKFPEILKKYAPTRSKSKSARKSRFANSYNTVSNVFEKIKKFFSHKGGLE